MNIIRICASCTKINAEEEDLDFFHRSIEAMIRQQRPELQVRVESSPCLKVCPVGKLTMTVSYAEEPTEAHLTMSREATLDSAVKEILSFFKPPKN